MVRWLEVILGIAAGLGTGGWLQGRWDRRHASDEAQKTRAHATAEAKAARQFEIMFEPYRQISIYLERWQGWVTATEPDVAPGPEPPEIPWGEAFFELGGTLAVTTTDSTRERLQASVKAIQGFRYALEEYRDEPVKGWEQESGKSPRLKLHEARGNAVAAIQAAQTAMRDELANL